MFSIDCSCCGRRSLIGSRRIRSITSHDAGFVVELACFCGESVFVQPDAASPTDPAAAAAAA